MKNSDRPASPIPIATHESVVYNTFHTEYGQYYGGLTKREEFAKAAMQGLLANPELSAGLIETIQVAIKSADELLKQLEEKP